MEHVSGGLVVSLRHTVNIIYCLVQEPGKSGYAF